MTDARSTRRWNTYRREYLRYNPTCAYCGAPATTVDHVIPVSKGGPMWDPHNHTPACQKCNQSKGNRTIPNSLKKGLDRPKGYSVLLSRELARFGRWSAEGGR